MSKKEIRFSILENPTEASPDELDFQVSRSEKERIFEMSRSKYEAKKKAAEPFETADEVSGVEVYHRPRWYRAVSAAAVIVAVVGGVAGSAFMVNSLKANEFHPATSVEADPGDIPIGALAEEPEPAPLSYDMSTKEGVYNKMLNCIDFFDKVSGSYIYRTDIYDHRVIDFCIDLSAKAFYDKTTIVTLNNLEDVVNGLPADTEILHEENRTNEFIFYSDGVQNCRIDGNVKDLGSRVGGLRERDETPMTSEDIEVIREWYYNCDGESYSSDDFYSATSAYRESELGEVALEYETQWMAAYFLTDPDTWEITGEETILDRDCVVIEGTVGKSFVLFTKSIGDFKMYVDKETGYLLRYIGYNAAGEVLGFCVYEDIHFDEDVEMVVLDLDAYETLDRSQPVSQNYSYTNSKGETYGNVGSLRLDQAHINSLPDLVSVGTDEGDFYIRTREFLDIFVDGEEAFNMQPVWNNISDTAVAVEVNFYNEEGEFVKTTTFYTEPENLVANQTKPEENDGNAEAIADTPEETTENTEETNENTEE